MSRKTQIPITLLTHPSLSSRDLHSLLGGSLNGLRVDLCRLHRAGLVRKLGPATGPKVRWTLPGPVPEATVLRAFAQSTSELSDLLLRTARRLETLEEKNKVLFSENIRLRARLSSAERALGKRK